MRRKLPQPWQRADRGNDWYITLNRDGRRQQVFLAPAGTPDAEVIRLAAAAISATRKASEGAGCTLWALGEAYLGHVERHQKKRTYEIRRQFLRPLCHRLGAQFRAADLLPLHVTSWLDATPEWGPTARRMAIQSVQALLNWGVRQGYLASNPIAKRVSAPPPVSRGADSRLPEEVLDLLLSGCTTDGQRHMLIALHQSGCRPGELASVTAQTFDPRARTWTVAGKTGTRVLALTPELFALSQQLAAKHPTGPLFRNEHNNAWCPRAIALLVRLIRARLAKKGIILDDRVVPYAIRHTRATELLASGVPVAIVAQQMGHSPATLHQHYAHIKAADVLPHLANVPPTCKVQQKGPGDQS
jgi:integrase